ncbi:MAG: hypothetical protein QM504_00125 [Pseudomonadota bacterium]
MTNTSSQFLEQFQGSFSGILRWHQLDELWLKVQEMNSNWYVYHVGEKVPEKTISTEKLSEFIQHLDHLLRTDHDEKYCGIVYVDDKQQPGFIKVYDPNNLGSVCGSSGAPPPLPGWTISLEQPTDLQLAFPPPANRRRWWKKIFSS